MTTTKDLSLAEKILQLKQEMLKHNKLRNFDPYPFQVEYMSDMSTEIGLRAANQIGSTSRSGFITGTAGDAIDARCESGGSNDIDFLHINWNVELL